MSDAYLTIAEASQRIAAGAVSATVLVEQCLARIDRHDGRVNAFHVVFRDEARAAARRLDAELKSGRRRGPLHGIPIALKDVFYMKGVPCTASSRLLLEFRPGENATVLDRLMEAGAIPLGTLDTFEWAFGGPAFDLPFAPARNPWNLERSPGGSSSGSAAAIAAGFCLGSVGSDAGGSIRSPASLTGISGIKPSYGRVSAFGDVPLTYSLDTVGPMAWTAEDCAILLQAIAGHDPKDPVSSTEPVDDYMGALAHGAKGLRIGVLRHFYAEDFTAHGEVIAAIDGAAETFRTLGAVVEETRVSSLWDYHAAGRMIVPAEAYAIHERWLKERPQDYGELLRNRLMLGAMIRAADYIEAQRLRAELIEEMNAVLARYDVVITAGQLLPQPRIADKMVFPFFKVPMIDIPFNITCHPALSVCAGFFSDGMPIGLQIAGKHFDETTVLCAGHAFEQATPWRGRRPDLG